MEKAINKTNEVMLEDKKISIAIMSSFAVFIIQYLILVNFNLIDTFEGSRIQLISKVIVGFLYLIALPPVLKRNKVKFVGIYFISIFIFLCNYIFFYENWIYLKAIIFPYFFICIPSFIYSYSIDDWNVLKGIMRKTSLLVFIVGVIIGALVFTNRASVGTYSMPLSYYMLLPTVVFMDEFIEKFTIKTIFIVLISFLIILALGSRGAIMCIGVFVIIKFIIKKKKLNYKTILIYIIIIFLVVNILLFLDTIFEYLYNFLLQFGIQSRSLQLFLKDDVYLSGRDYLYKEMIGEIINNPIFGIGLAGDRRIIGGYAHNIVIEVFANFGIIIGSILVLLLVFISFRTLFSKDKEVSNFIAIWFSIGFIHLTVSGSYLTDLKFWIFLGLVIKSLRDSREDRRIKNIEFSNIRNLEYKYKVFK